MSDARWAAIGVVVMLGALLLYGVRAYFNWICATAMLKRPRRKNEPPTEAELERAGRAMASAIETVARAAAKAQERTP